jgi:hypothetical protein
LGLVYTRYLLGYSWETYDKEEWEKRFTGIDITL